MIGYLHGMLSVDRCEPFDPDYGWRVRRHRRELGYAQTIRTAVELQDDYECGRLRAVEKRADRKEAMRERADRAARAA
jgi:hypothetical protein